MRLTDPVPQRTQVCLAIMTIDLNVLGTPLQSCSLNPLTGWKRDGCCRGDPEDRGMHHICAIMTEEFLGFAFSRGNDLITPRPEFGFPGLGPGDHWCLCALRWQEALLAHAAPRVRLEATHLNALGVVTLQDLQAHAQR
jgi:uncharacterized protein (DUF2237 family)